MNAKILMSVILAVSMCVLIAPLAAREESKLPETTKDGLHLERHTRHGAVYVKPGATLEAWAKILVKRLDEAHGKTSK